MTGLGGIHRHIGALPFEIVMAAGVVVMAAQHDWFHVGTALFTTVVSFLPLLVERLFRVYLPAWVQITYVIFVFASMFSGEVLKFYRNVPGWDETMHFMSGILVGFAVLLWLGWLENKKQIYPIWLRCLLIICINMTVAVLWEIVEFASDQLFGTTSQDQSLFDTMTDLIYGALGGIVLAIIYTKVVHAKQSLFMQKIAEFKVLNK